MWQIWAEKSVCFKVGWSRIFCVLFQNDYKNKKSAATKRKSSKDNQLDLDPPSGQAQEKRVGESLQEEDEQPRRTTPKKQEHTHHHHHHHHRRLQHQGHSQTPDDIEVQPSRFNSQRLARKYLSEEKEEVKGLVEEEEEEEKAAAANYNQHGQNHYHRHHRHHHHQHHQRNSQPNFKENYEQEHIHRSRQHRHHQHVLPRTHQLDHNPVHNHHNYHHHRARDKDRDRYRDRDRHRDRDRERDRERHKDKEREQDRNQGRDRDRDARLWWRDSYAQLDRCLYCGPIIGLMLLKLSLMHYKTGQNVFCHLFPISNAHTFSLFST